MILVAAVIAAVYCFLYTTDSYTTAARTVSRCETTPHAFAIINPLGTSVQLRGSRGEAEYKLLIFGTRFYPWSSTVGLTRKDGVWVAKYMIVRGTSVNPDSCLVAHARQERA
ncbi:hypothetical protein ACO2TI_17890 [Caldimonas sp. KR1-144]